VCVCVLLCRGESGAGKTENTKKVISYFASVAAASTKAEGEEEAPKVLRSRRHITAHRGSSHPRTGPGAQWRHQVKQVSKVFWQKPASPTWLQMDSFDLDPSLIIHGYLDPCESVPANGISIGFAVLHSISACPTHRQTHRLRYVRHL